MGNVQKSVIFRKGHKTFLRPLRRETDFEACLRWINDPEVTQYLSSYLPVGEKMQEEWFDRVVSHNPNGVTFAIETLQDHTFIGVMGLNQINWKDRIAVTAAMIGENAYWGKGYGSDARMILLDYAFNTLNLRKICSSALIFNKRSIGYHIKCGYKEEGRRVKQIYKNGEYWDEVLFGVFREDWLPLWETYKDTGKMMPREKEKDARRLSENEHYRLCEPWFGMSIARRDRSRALTSSCLRHAVAAPLRHNVLPKALSSP